MPSLLPTPSFNNTRERLHDALATYHEKRQELEASQQDDGENVLIVGANIPGVLRDLAHAALDHAEVVERKMDSLYQRQLFGESDGGFDADADAGDQARAA